MGIAWWLQGHLYGQATPASPDPYLEPIDLSQAKYYLSFIPLIFYLESGSLIYRTYLYRRCYLYKCFNISIAVYTDWVNYHQETVFQIVLCLNMPKINYWVPGLSKFEPCWTGLPSCLSKIDNHGVWRDAPNPLLSVYKGNTHTYIHKTSLKK